MAIEQRLIHKIGDVGELHTAGAATIRFAWTCAFISGCDQPVLPHCGSAKAFVSVAEQHMGVIMPGYTHTQHAQPVLLSHHLMAYCEMFRRDERLRTVSNGQTFFRSAARHWQAPLPVDMELTQALNSAVTANIDAVSSEGCLIRCAFYCHLMMHVSRIAEELILWSTTEFAFIEISDAFAQARASCLRRRTFRTHAW